MVLLLGALHLLPTFWKAMTEIPMKITYADGKTEVKIGDRVTSRLWFRLFRKTLGRVVYVPGVTPKNPEMEHHGLRWVGVNIASGSVYGLLVDPKTNALQKSAKFDGRDESPIQALRPDQVSDDGS